jgi:hypothetical protein
MRRAPTGVHEARDEPATGTLAEAPAGAAVGGGNRLDRGAEAQEIHLGPAQPGRHEHPEKPRAGQRGDDRGRQTARLLDLVARRGDPGSEPAGGADEGFGRRWRALFDRHGLCRAHLT